MLAGLDAPPPRASGARSSLHGAGLGAPLSRVDLTCSDGRCGAMPRDGARRGR